MDSRRPRNAARRYPRRPLAPALPAAACPRASAAATSRDVRPDAGPETNDQSNLSEVSSNLAVGQRQHRVGLNYEGRGLSDANANGHRDAEKAASAPLWVKLTPRAGGQPAGADVGRPRGPAAAIISDAAGEYCLIASDNRDPADIAPSTPGWVALADGGSISISNADLRNRDLGLYRGLIRAVFRDTGTPASVRTHRNNGRGRRGTGLPGVGASRRRRVYSSGSTMPTAPTRCSCPCRRTAAPPPASPSKWRRPIRRPCLHRRSCRARPIGFGQRRRHAIHLRPRRRHPRLPGARGVLDGLDFGDVPDSRLSHDGNLDGTPARR